MTSYKSTLAQSKQQDFKRIISFRRGSRDKSGTVSAGSKKITNTGYVISYHSRLSSSAKK